MPVRKGGSRLKQEGLTLVGQETLVSKLLQQQHSHLNCYNLVLRAVAESRVRWAFWPPDTDISAMEGRAGDGIWIPHASGIDSDSELESDDESEPLHSEGTPELEDQSDIEEDEHEEGEGETQLNVAGVGRFGALVLHDEDEENSEEDYCP